MSKNEQFSNECVLGIDASTQSFSGVVVDVKSFQIVWSHSISYKSDPRLARWNVDPATFVLPPRYEGEADQPAGMFLSALDAFLSDLRRVEGLAPSIRTINVSAQQHGHVYCSSDFFTFCDDLRSGAARFKALDERSSDVFSYERAPIWKTSDTAQQAEDLRRGVGGSKAMIAATGSDSPLRFTGAIVRKVGQREPREYEKTKRIHLLSSFVPAVLTGNPDVPFDWGNSSGVSLMDYSRKRWHDGLLEAASQGLAGGLRALESKLPSLASPLTWAGEIASYFVRNYGFDPRCRVMIGSGDNPQSKVLIENDLLSLGTSFVMMVSSDDPMVDERGWGNAMYDGIGRPFLFGCRTNGALVWDLIRNHGTAHSFSQAEQALSRHRCGSVVKLWQPDVESFPPSPKAEVEWGEFSSDYASSVDSALGLLWWGSRPWTDGKTGVLAVTGGPTSSPGIVRRIAAIWNRPVKVIGSTGAALGTAMAALVMHKPGDSAWVTQLENRLLPATSIVEPEEEDVRAYHGKGGYLERLKEAFEGKFRQKL